MALFEAVFSALLKPAPRNKSPERTTVELGSFMLALEVCLEVSKDDA